MVLDLRGRFLRGVDAGAGNDPDRGALTAQHVGGNTGDAVGSVQSDSFQGHKHTSTNFTVNNEGSTKVWALPGGFGNGYSKLETLMTGYGNDGVNGVPRTASETRPKNANVTYIIKY